MADNVQITPGSGATVAADEIAGVLHQLVKVEFGDPDAATQVSANNPLPGSVKDMPAASRTTDALAAVLASDALVTGDSSTGNLTALTPKFAKIVASTSGATTIVAAVASKRIRVVSWTLVANAAVNVKWQSHVTPTDLTGLYYLAANGGLAVPFSPVGYFQTTAGEALDINLSGAVAVGGSLVYVEV